jgi:hypothetical protein
LLRAGFLLVAATFAVVTLVLVGQVVDATLRPVPGLFYLFAACDPPAIVGAWLAAAGAHRSTEKAAVSVRRPLLAAAVGLTVVGVVVLGDFLLARVAPASSLAAIVASKPAWLIADAATVVGLGTLGLAAARVVRASGRTFPSAVGFTVAAMLAARAAGGLWGALGAVPWQFRVLEAVLYAGVAWSAWAASRGLTPERRRSP